MKLNEWLEILSQEVRETTRLADAAWQEVEQTKKYVSEVERKADAAWELVNIIRNDVKRPLWKKWLGIK